MRTRIKICGITRPGDALAAAEAGADAVGLVFYPQSPRYLAAERAVGIRDALPPFVQTVALFVNPDAAQVAPDEALAKSVVIAGERADPPGRLARLERREHESALFATFGRGADACPDVGELDLSVRDNGAGRIFDGADDGAGRSNLRADTGGRREEHDPDNRGNLQAQRHVNLRG